MEPPENWRGRPGEKATSESSVVGDGHRKSTPAAAVIDITGDLLAYARLAADARGCTCEPHIDIAELCPGIYNANIHHDNWCPALAGDAA